jgi:methanogenic corrinoid protein MtbC1
MSGRTGRPPTLRTEAAAEDYLARLAEADEDGAIDLITGLLDEGVPAEDLLLEVIAPVQRHVGRLWAENRWSVAREHAATAVSRTGWRGRTGQCGAAWMDGVSIQGRTARSRCRTRPGERQPRSPTAG